MLLFPMYLPPEQEGHGPVGASSEEVIELIKGMEDSAMRKGWRVGIAQPGEALGWPNCGLPEPEGADKEGEERLQGMEDRTVGTASY